MKMILNSLPWQAEDLPRPLTQPDMAEVDVRGLASAILNPLGTGEN